MRIEWPRTVGNNYEISEFEDQPREVKVEYWEKAKAWASEEPRRLLFISSQGSERVKVLKCLAADLWRSDMQNGEVPECPW